MRTCGKAQKGSVLVRQEHSDLFLHGDLRRRQGFSTRTAGTIGENDPTLSCVR
jgi:hypothetical protein